jgi:7-cyano-7-deazaguanine reductase
VKCQKQENFFVDAPLLKESPLGKSIPYLTTYQPALLFAMPRAYARDQIGLKGACPFKGVDIWNAYEVSWLTPSGKPEVAILECAVPCHSLGLIESKSFKLYLHSFNQTTFSSREEVAGILKKDLSSVCEADVGISLFMPEEFKSLHMTDFADPNFKGRCLDSLDVQTDVYQVDAKLLQVESGAEFVEERLYSDLLKSNCLVTGQPDWGHVLIHYAGKKIDHRSLLKYIISYRKHNGFHEQCIERMFMDLLSECKPEKLSIYGRYTRRGGLDINPFRSNWEEAPSANYRLYRQ